MQCANKVQQKSPVPTNDSESTCEQADGKHGAARGKSSGLRCKRAKYLFFSSHTVILIINNSVE